MLAIHSDELAPYTLQLWKCHWCCWKFKWLLHVLNGDLTTSFALVVLLVRYDLGDDIGSGFVELVKVVLLSGRFLGPLVRSMHGVAYTIHTSTVAWFGRTTFIFPSLPTMASHI